MFPGCRQARQETDPGGGQQREDIIVLTETGHRLVTAVGRHYTCYDAKLCTRKDPPRFLHALARFMMAETAST